MPRRPTAVPREPDTIAQVSLRIPEGLRSKLEERARRHRLSLNHEIRIRLEDSLLDEVRADLRDILQDIKNHWARFGVKNNRTELGDQLAEAIMRANNLAEIKALASGWAEQRKFEKQIEAIIQAGDTAAIRELQKRLGVER